MNQKERKAVDGFINALFDPNMTDEHRKDTARVLTLAVFVYHIWADYPIDSDDLDGFADWLENKAMKKAVDEMLKEIWK